VSTPQALVGTQLAGYSLQALVGEGGTSVVYRAEHPEHGLVALKVLKAKLRQDRTSVARFLREARLGERVEHPNVVRTIEYGEADTGQHYLAIEWAQGELLERYLKRRGALPPAEVAAIVRQIAKAVHAAHALGIVHRDLKPDNLMYDPETGHVKLLDFGIAAQTDTAPDERLTRAGFFVGTLMYVAPESLSGELVGPAADQYSLATIAYCMLTGCMPYSANTPREMFTLLLSEPPTPLNRANPTLEFSDEVHEVAMRGLARQPSDRFPNVLAFADALADALAKPDAVVTRSPESSRGGLMAKVRGIFRK
jgi:serine/threonine protein kinase